MRIFQFILDTIIPPNPLIRTIENMSVKDFIVKAGNLAKKDLSKGVMSFLPYKNEIVSTSLIEIKTYRNRKVTALLGAVLYENLKNLTDEHSLLIPVPMTKKSIRKRGWNQCKLLVKEIIKNDTQNKFELCTDVLIKIRDNEDQVGKSRKERFENLSGCFEIKNADKVRGKNIIVLDDIVTTGATLAEAHRALANTGTIKITLVSVAH